VEEKSDLSQKHIKQCPKCGHSPISQAECPACGIVVAKYLKGQTMKTEKRAVPLGVQKPGSKPKTLTQIAIALIVFGSICLISALFVNFSRGKSISKSLPLQGGIVGPIQVKKDRTVYLVEVFQRVNYGQWSSVTGNVLDQDKNYLFGFGEELWAESGRDSEGTWAESKNSYKMKMTLQKGTYYFEFESERSRNVSGNITILVHRKRGSPLPFLIAGIIALIIGVVVNEIANQTFTKRIEAI